MSINKDHPKPEVTVNSDETLQTLKKTYFHQKYQEAKESEAELEFFGLSTSLNEPETLQQLLAAERASHKEQLAQMEAHYKAKMNDFHGKWETRYYRDTNALRARMTELGGFKIQAQIQINESERLRIQAMEDLKAYKAHTKAELEELEEARLEAQRAMVKLNEAEQLKIQALEDLEACKSESEAYKIQAQAKLNKSESLRIQTLKAWQACKSEFEDYRTLTQGEFEELENARVKAHRVLVTERAAHSAQLQQVYDNWDAKYKKDIGYLKGKLAEVEARQAEARQAEARQAEARQAEARQAEARQAEARQAEARQAEARQVRSETEDLKFSKMQEEITRLNQLVESQEAAAMKLEEARRAKDEEMEQELRGKTLLEIQLEKHQEDLESQLEKSQAEVRRVWGIVMEMEEKLEETKTQLTLVQAPNKRGRSSKDQDAAKSAKKRKIN